MKRKDNNTNYKIESLRKEYIKDYGIDLEKKWDKLFNYKTPIRVFCNDCKKYHTQGRDDNKKLIRVVNGCKGSDIEWDICIYRKRALEVINDV